MTVSFIFNQLISFRYFNNLLGIKMLYVFRMNILEKLVVLNIQVIVTAVLRKIFKVCLVVL